MTKHILITGGSGFIGGCLYRYMLGHGHELYRTVHADHYEECGQTIKADLTNQEHVDRLIEYTMPDAVFHLAGRATMGSPEKELIECNVRITQNLLKYDYDFLLASSATVYGDNTNWMCPGDETYELTPTSLYGRTKVMCEQAVEDRMKNGKKKYIIARLTANVGREATHGSVMDITRKWLHNDEVRLFGTSPGSTKPYTHVKDTVYALDKLLLGEAASGIYNVSVADTMSILQITHCLEYLCGKRTVIWDASLVAKNDNPYVKVDNQKMLSTGIRLLYRTAEDAVITAIQDIIFDERKS